MVGKPRRILRRSPPQHVSRDERERLVDMASKLIVATVSQSFEISNRTRSTVKFHKHRTLKV